MSEHTPGPWEVVQHNHVDDELWLSVNQHADAEGMREWVAEIKYLTTDPERQWANARLIAAAPELLRMLKATEWVRANSPAFCYVCGRERWVGHAEDCEVSNAIRKAEGRG